MEYGGWDGDVFESTECIGIRCEDEKLSTNSTQDSYYSASGSSEVSWESYLDDSPSAHSSVDYYHPPSSSSSSSSLNKSNLKFKNEEDIKTKEVKKFSKYKDSKFTTRTLKNPYYAFNENEMFKNDCNEGDEACFKLQKYWIRNGNGLWLRNWQRYSSSQGRRSDGQYNNEYGSDYELSQQKTWNDQGELSNESRSWYNRRIKYTKENSHRLLKDHLRERNN